MRFRGTAALFLVLLLLGGYVYWTEIRGREARERAEADAVRVLPVDGEEIARIRLVYPGLEFEARRTDGGWEFVDPAGLEADSGQWDTLAGNVPRVEFDEIVATEAADLSTFGLDEPRVRVEVGLVDGTTESILFGSENPGGDSHYLKRGSDDDIMLGATSWSGLFEKDLAAMRDKTVLRFDQDSVSGIEISGGTSVALNQVGGGWRIEEPVVWPADQSLVTTLLGTLSFVRAVDFADELPDTETGLGSPTWRVRLDEGEAVSHEFVVGDRVPGTANGDVQYFARDESRAAVFVIDAELPEMLGRPLIDWRDRHVAQFDRDLVLAIEIDGETTVQLSRTDSASPWLASTGEPADSAQVLTLLDALEFGQATAIIDDPGTPATYGLGDPRARVTLRGADDAALLEGAFGAETSDGGVYWFRSATPEVVYEVSLDVLEDVLAVASVVTGP